MDEMSPKYVVTTRKGKKCAIWFCREARYSLGLCTKHYVNYGRNNGDPLPQTDVDLHYIMENTSSLVDGVLKLLERLPHFARGDVRPEDSDLVEEVRRQAQSMMSEPYGEAARVRAAPPPAHKIHKNGDDDDS